MTDNSRLIPFLWLHGEDGETLRRAIREIAASGCGSVCAESRLHPDYLGESWWQEIDILLDECKKQNLTLWVLDDTHYPSGFANGAASGTPYQRMMMTEVHMDIVGPCKGGRVLVWPDQSKGMLVAVVASRRVSREGLMEGHVDIGGWSVTDLLDLTDGVEDGFIRWDVPKGEWRVFILTANYVSERNPPQQFVNPLLPESAQLMIDTIYERHYQHMKNHFGKTFKGFFSDEPALRAGRGCKAVLGEYPMLPIPWRMDMPAILSEQMGRPARVLLPGLWYDIGEDTPRIRYALMDAVSRLYGENYSMPIGNWCREHGVEYIGHVIEQNNAHSRLGQGAGHFFRAMSGQDMAGMDLVLHELKPEFRDTSHAWKSQDFEADDDFFRYMLPQMTVSCAHLDPKKKGRSLCEIFGAYGWQEDVEEMRYIANLLLSRGINHFTPHAFSLKPVPDSDAPPHFGRFNPLMSAISRLYGHMARVGSLIDGGSMVARTAVLYYAEAEWAQGKSCMKTQTIVKALNQAQVACEIVPIDLLVAGRYDVIYIPEADMWPEKLFHHLHLLMAAGCRIVFVGAKPKALSEGTSNLDALMQGMQAIHLAQVAQDAKANCHLPMKIAGDNPDIHSYPYRKDGKMLVVLFNEDVRKKHDIVLTELQEMNAPVVYDSEQQRCWKLSDMPCTISMDPGQLLIVSDMRPDWPDPQPQPSYSVCGSISPVWTITFPGTDYEPLVTDTPDDLNSIYPRFSGLARYEGKIMLDAPYSALLLQEVSGSVSVYVDGQLLGHRDAAPYIFSNTMRKGEHTLTVEVVNTLVFRYHDSLSMYNYIKPTGLLGPVMLMK